MHFVVFGLSISSSWGNGHATLWRGMLKAMVERGHTVSFYEKNVPYYASTRDGWHCPAGVTLRLYDTLEEVRSMAMREFASADVALWTSYCPEGAPVSQMILNSSAAIKAFYDLDTPVTLSALRSGATVEYLPPEGLAGFDLVLSYTGGRALQELESRLGAGRVVPLYGSFDPETHYPVAAMDEFRGALGYLGTFAADRQRAVEELFVRPASRMPEQRFVLGGAQYPENFPWTNNIFFVRHLPPSLHPAFFCSGRATLNVTRSSMAEYGYCPSGRLFEAAACGAAILSDWWEGVDIFFTLGEEILRVDSASDVIDALGLSDKELRRIGDAARQRALEQHTAASRIAELESICESVISDRGHTISRDVSEVA
ncbi:MAG: glycosyltransferase [Candidatus Sulfotelmatobacter sp.]